MIELIQERLAFLREFNAANGDDWTGGYAYAIANEIAFLESLLESANVVSS